MVGVVCVLLCVVIVASVLTCGARCWLLFIGCCVWLLVVRCVMAVVVCCCCVLCVVGCLFLLIVACRCSLSLVVCWLLCVFDDCLWSLIVVVVHWMCVVCIRCFVRG